MKLTLNRQLNWILKTLNFKAMEEFKTFKTPPPPFTLLEIEDENGVKCETMCDPNLIFYFPLSYQGSNVIKLWRLSPRKFE